MRLRYIPVALLVSSLGTACAQDSVAFNSAWQQSRSAARHTLSGTVVNSVTGEPIRRALVTVNGPESHSAFTNPDGRFEMPNIPEGQLFLVAQKPGFFDPATLPGMRTSTPAVTLGPSTGDVVLKLAPEAKIRGRVLDNSGEPIEGLNVQLLARDLSEGRSQWQQRGQATTDDGGAYTLENLTPGMYAIHTLSRPANLITGHPVNGETPPQVFPPTYYPAAPDRSSLQTLDLKPGQELTVDLSLSPVAAFRVSGVLTGAQPAIAVLCEDSDGQSVSTQMSYDARTNKFVIGGVPPGSWTLHAFSQPSQEGAFEVEQPIEVTSADLKGLVLQLQLLPSIPVHVQGRDETDGPPGLMLTATSVMGNQNRTYTASQPPGGPSNSLVIDGIPPGRFRVSARVFNRSQCLDSLRSGNTDLTREELTISPGSQPSSIDVTLRNDCASISGTVHSSSEQPAASSLILLSDAPLMPPGVLAAGPEGKFTIPNLTPGSYRLYALNNINDLEYANPETLRDFTGQQVTVGPGENATVQLDLIRRSH